MREIKFRGKRLDNGEWVIGSLYQDYDMPECASIIPIGSLEDKWQDIYRITAYDVDYKTVEQFTGLKDKNGIDVYEWDIVKALKHNEDLFTDKVCWRSGILWFGNWNWIEFQNIFRNIEVIGNIHENPELLEATKC